MDFWVNLTHCLMIKLLYRLLFAWKFKKNIFFDNIEPILIVVWIYFFHCCRANNQSINHQSVGRRIEEREKHNHFANQPRSNYNCGGNMILSAKLDFTLRFWASASFINWTQTCGRQNCFFFQLFFSRFLSEFSIHFFTNDHATSVLIQLIGR